jgi:hypothetical protein
MRNINRLILVVLILIGAVSGFALVMSSQDIRNEAKVPEDVGQLVLTVTKPSADSVMNKVEIAFKTAKDGNNAESISVVGFRIRIPAAQKIVNDKNEEVGELTVNGELDDTWEYPVNSVISDKEWKVIDFAAVNTSKQGYTSTATTELVQFYVRTEMPVIELPLGFDQDYAVMYSKRRPVTDILTAEMPSAYQVFVR